MSTSTAAPDVSRSPSRGDGSYTSGAAWHFVRHYLEMVVAMILGMAVLGSASRMVVGLPDATAVRLVEMAVWMTVPMIAWMRIRRHRWRVCNEMAAAMLLPAGGALALLASGVVTDPDTLLMAEHTVMLPAMFLVMRLRRHEYTGHTGHEVPQPRA